MKLRQIVTMGSVDTLEQKTVTVCYGTDFVNVNFVNFCCTRRDIAQVSKTAGQGGEYSGFTTTRCDGGQLMLCPGQISKVIVD